MRDQKFTVQLLSAYQNDLYSDYQSILSSYPRVGRLGIFLVIPIDYSLDVVKKPAHAIESMVFAIINLCGCMLGCFFNMPEYSFKHSVESVECMSKDLLIIPIVLITRALQSLSQTTQILYNGKESAKSIHPDWQDPIRWNGIKFYGNSPKNDKIKQATTPKANYSPPPYSNNSLKSPVPVPPRIKIVTSEGDLAHLNED